ncbi:MAG TPA: hypothetical protein VFF23_14445 [Hanamia sp.]|nr:hypothetical protein [Hanamia sp.]
MEDAARTMLLTVSKLLVKYSVNYMIVGGTAMALHGYYRHSINASGELTEKPDIDIWYNPTYENYFRILKVIEALGKDISEFMNEQSPHPKQSFFKLDFKHFTFDILPMIKAGIKFSDAYQRKEIIELDKTPIYFLNYFDLIEDKTATARKKDIEDIEQLKKIKNSKQK